MDPPERDERCLFEALVGDGRPLLLRTGVVLILCGGFVIFQSATGQFLPQDVQYLGMTARDLCRLDQCRIVHFMFHDPLIAHDRAGFGGRICCTGITILFCVWCGRRSRSLWQVLCVAGLVGFGTAILIHPIVGYLSFTHLAPAVLVAMIFLLGLELCYRPMVMGVVAEPRFPLDAGVQETAIVEQL